MKTVILLTSLIATAMQSQGLPFNLKWGQSVGQAKKVVKSKDFSEVYSNDSVTRILFHAPLVKNLKGLIVPVDVYFFKDSLAEINISLKAAPDLDKEKFTFIIYHHYVVEYGEPDAEQSYEGKGKPADNVMHTYKWNLSENSFVVMQSLIDDSIIITFIYSPLESRW